ncbi:MAG: hypothetical protein BM558_06655 [Roseobacter sp. MedPE-SW]|nr:MAG: hypothetical protein BM558_06655 [Roseobacter sp. MedPE-SW]
MRKTLYLHIGHFKTGTTAIQQFLHLNPRLLKRHDLAYAETKREHFKHSDLAFSLYQAAGVQELMHGYAKQETPQQVWASVFDELRRSRQSGMIVSTEELIRLACFPQALNILKQIVEAAPDIDIKVIAYLRAPESHLRSWYNQLVKMGCKTPSYNAAISQKIEPVHYDYALALRPWISLFGAEAISLRPYSKESREDYVLFDDFLSIFGIKRPSRGVTLFSEDPNPRMAEDGVEVARVLQNVDAPRWVVKSTQDRFIAFSQGEQFQDLSVKGDPFEKVRCRTLAGLEQLALELPEFSEALAQLRADLPVPNEKSSEDGWHLAGFLLAELNTLRKSVVKQNMAFEKRLAALETQFPAKDTKPS